MPHVLSQPEFGPGSGNPRLAAANDPGTAEHAQMLQLLTGGKQKKNKRGGAEASQFNLQYNPGGQNPNTIVATLQGNQLQSAENAKLDGALANSAVANGAVAKGGAHTKGTKKKRRRGTKKRMATKRRRKGRSSKKRR